MRERKHYVRQIRRGEAVRKEGEGEELQITGLRERARRDPRAVLSTALLFL